MWTLEGNANNPDKIHYLPCGVSLIVSRKEGHVLLQGDSSISRQHASIIITHPANNLKYINNLPEVKLRDLGAKYGTYVNDGIEQDLKIDGVTALADGDRVRFGMLTNTWRVKYRPLVVTTSTLEVESKGELQNALVKLGGHVVSDWNSFCSYLVMNNITLTVKVVCALAAARQIVTPKFFYKLVDAVVTRTPHPDSTQFLPPLQELSINQNLADFSPNEQRKRVLSGQTFIFSSSKQLKRMGPAVTLAGGNTTLLSEENIDFVASRNYLLVQLLPEKNQTPEQTALFVAAKSIVKGKGLRVIPESDIGLAILYLSTEAHCNPSFKVSTILKRNGSEVTQANEGIQIYATETQDLEESSLSLTSTRLVPETGVSSSRRTPATLPGTSLPLSNTSYPVTLTNTLSTSTNASMLPPPESPLPLKSDPEDKEISLQSTRKRVRTVSNGCVKPEAKRRNSKPPATEELEPTQPMDGQDNEEENELIVSKFEPKHISTQRNNNDDDNERPSEGHVNARSDVSNDVTGIQSIEPTTGRSIAFEPYTLPSLNVDHVKDDEVLAIEDDVSTQPYTGVKEEPASLPVDEPDCYSGKRRREEDLNVRNVEENHWLGRKKNRTDNLDNINIKAERRSIDENTIVNPQPVKQEQQNEEDYFALPQTSERSRRRAEAKRKTTEDPSTNGADQDFFALPTSSRAERRRKLLKTEEGNSKIVAKKEIVDESATTPNNHPSTSTSNENRGTSANESWISKEGGEGTVPAPAGVPPKAELKYGDVADLSSSFEKSLVVVEVASLIRRRPKNTVPTSNSQNTSIGSLQNFKKFRKSVSDIMSLPKIIGGRDLVPHDAVMERRDDWFRDNQEVTLLYEEREAQQRVNDDDLDAMFDLPQNPRSRARKRR